MNRMLQPAPLRIRRAPGAAAVAVADARTPDELLAALHAGRGLAPGEEAAPGLAALIPPQRLRGLDTAAALVAERIRAGAHLLIVGDYDADGATGSTLAVRGLRALGAARVSWLIPSRFAFGYGLSPPVVEVALERQPDLLITVDNGIASRAGVARARDAGLPVIVTDHHLAGAELPEAAAIVNPNQPGCDFPSKHLAGVGVVFYLLIAVRARLRAAGWFGAARPEPNLAAWLDLVALGTVADVVVLDRNNRILVEQGLRRIRAGQGCAGIQALLRVAGRDPARATAADLAFYAGPRLNAAGRLGDMSDGVECLLTDDPARALELADMLDDENRERRRIEDGMRGQAEDFIENLLFDGQALPAGLCLFGADWHQGVSGIVAARIRERYHRPTIAFAPAGDGRVRGSARSVDALHLRDTLALVDARHPGLIERFGGHAMAAGLTLAAEALDAFGVAFAAAVREQLGELPPGPELHSDGELPPRLLNLETARRLRHAGPWGRGFPEPCFDGWFEIAQARLVGERHLRLRVVPPDGASPLDAIGFRMGERLPELQGRLRLAYRLDVNHYRGIDRPQLIVQHLETGAA